MNIVRIFLVAGGTLLIASGIAQGLAFGLTADGPAMQGLIGGLYPSVSAVIGTLLLVWANRK